jgi:hypothetical protein
LAESSATVFVPLGTARLMAEQLSLMMIPPASSMIFVYPLRSASDLMARGVKIHSSQLGCTLRPSMSCAASQICSIV